MLFIRTFRIQFLPQFNILSSPPDTLLTRVSFGSFSSIATWLPPTSYPVQTSHQVPSADHARNSTPRRHSSQTRESVSYPKHSQTSPQETTSPRCVTHSRSTSQVGSTPPSCGVQPTVLRNAHRLPLIVIRCAHLISPHSPKSRVCNLVPTHRAQIQHGPLLVLSTP